MQAKLFETLKTVLRARKITYADLAQRLGTSEPTVKRIFAARDGKLSRIVAICDVLGLSLDDVIAQASRTEVKPLLLGDRIEAQLADDPSAFHLFLLLRDGMTAEAVARHYDLPPRAMFDLGRRLEKIGLVEVLPGDRIRLRVEHPIRFRRDGPLHRSLMKLNMDFLREAFLGPDTDRTGFLTQSRRISEGTARHMMEELRRLNRDLSEMARQDQLTLPDSALRSHKLSLAWAPVDFSRLLKIDAPQSPAAATGRFTSGVSSDKM